MARLAQIEGVGRVYAAKLRKAGVRSEEGLLDAGSTPKGRAKLAHDAEISERMILKWVNRADLDRIKGVGEEYADLLEASGVDTVPELAHRDAEHLHDRMVDVNSHKRLVRAMPSSHRIEGWIGQAKQLPRVVRY